MCEIYCYMSDVECWFPGPSFDCSRVTCQFPLTISMQSTSLKDFLVLDQAEVEVLLTQLTLHWITLSEGEGDEKLASDSVQAVSLF